MKFTKILRTAAYEEGLNAIKLFSHPNKLSTQTEGSKNIDLQTKRLFTISKTSPLKELNQIPETNPIRYGQELISTIWHIGKLHTSLLNVQPKYGIDYSLKVAEQRPSTNEYQCPSMF